MEWMEIERSVRLHGGRVSSVTCDYPRSCPGARIPAGNRTWFSSSLAFVIPKLKE
jgi:hypothetical protein